MSDFPIYGYKDTFDKIVEHVKKYPNTTVKAALTRLSNIMDVNNHVYTTLSGGKDSGLTTVLLSVIIMLRKKVLNGEISISEYNSLFETNSSEELMKTDGPCGVMAMDTEMMYSYTSEFLERMFKTYCGSYEIGDLSWVDKKNKENNPGCYSYEDIEKMSTKQIQSLITGYGQKSLMLGFWCCFPTAWENSASLKDSRYYSFDPTKKEIWTRPLPEGSYVWSSDNFLEFPLQYGMMPPTDDDVSMGQTDQTLRTAFSKWWKKSWEDIDEHNGKPKGKCGVLVAIRAAESFDRRTILKQGDYKFGYYGQQFGVRQYSPVLDMTNDDVYRSYSVFGIEINHAYNQMYDAGIPIGEMRIGSLVNSHAGDSTKWLSVLDPAASAKIVSRLDGVNFNSAYNNRSSRSKYLEIPQIKPFNSGMPSKAQELAIELLGLEYMEIQ